jgi:hypothetical protein
MLGWWKEATMFRQPLVTMVAMVIGITYTMMGKLWTKNEKTLGAWKEATILGQPCGWWQWF